MNNYLEKKREKFGRFYFLSNEDLIEILSLQREPQRVQPHLRKVFESIDKVVFNQNLNVIAMVSCELEEIGFLSSV